MTKEELQIGHTYHGKFALKLVGFDNEGDPVLSPQSTYPTDRLYTSDDEKENPEWKAGCCGMYIEQFLKDYRP